MNIFWTQQNNEFRMREATHLFDELQVGIYLIDFDNHGFFLNLTDEKFEFPFKIYGHPEKFVDRASRTFDATTGNLGILLNGIKGTGKTVTAKMICNHFKLPIILVNKKFNENQNLLNFLNCFQQDIIVFIDEYEKIFSQYDDSLLSILDGAMNNKYRKIFVLTTNDLNINRNMLQRPGRIRYIKSYTDLTPEEITEIVDDILIHKELRNECIDFISHLNLITIDLVKALIQEVNIHHESPVTFADFFNIRSLDSKWFDVYEIKENEKALIAQSADVEGGEPGLFREGRSIRINGNTIGKIDEIVLPHVLKIRSTVYSDDDNEAEKYVYRILEFIEVKKLHINYRLTV